MALPHASVAFGDLLDRRFQRIFHDQYDQVPDKLPALFTFIPHNGRNNMMWSEVGAFADWTAFSGQVNYDSITQGYDTTVTFLEKCSGFQIERRLFDDDQFHIMDQRPAGLGTAGGRTRQKDGARIWNMAFSVDTYFYNRSEAVALCSNSHTTNAPGVSTTSGFDNLGTSALSATAVAAARIAVTGFRDDRGNLIQSIANELLYPPNLYEEAWEIVNSSGKLDTAYNNKNVHEGTYQLQEWSLLTNTRNWFLHDISMRKAMLFWIDRIPMEFAYAEDLDTLVGKFRGYMRYANGFIDWRWAYGHQVA